MSKLETKAPVAEVPETQKSFNRLPEASLSVLNNVYGTQDFALRAAKEELSKGHYKLPSDQRMKELFKALATDETVKKENSTWLADAVKTILSNVNHKAGADESIATFLRKYLPQTELGFYRTVMTFVEREPSATAGGWDTIKGGGRYRLKFMGRDTVSDEK